MESIYQIQMRAFLKELGYNFEEEHKFHPKRRWKFDFILKGNDKIAIEINGGIWIKGRHNFGRNYEKDLEKINTAQMMGWKVLQYTPDTLTNIQKDLEFLLDNKTK